MPTEICKYRHDHTKENVTVPLKPGRKYHCPDDLSPMKHRPGNWKEVSLSEAQKSGLTPCKRCFG